MKRIGWIAIMAAVLLITGTQVVAQPDAVPAENGPKRPASGCPALANPETHQKFLAETAPLREELAAKRGEYRAIMAQEDPDPKRAGELSREMTKLQDQIRLKALALGMPCGAGPGCGMGSDGCMGKGRVGHGGMGKMGGKGGCPWQQ
ncbi:MAG: hypothetical protein ACOZF0_15875 [Thermodesulfobacteriota bacterium]